VAILKKKIEKLVSKTSKRKHIARAAEKDIKIVLRTKIKAKRKSRKDWKKSWIKIKNKQKNCS
jgi:hypothetical protein